MNEEKKDMLNNEEIGEGMNTEELPEFPDLNVELDDMGQAKINMEEYQTKHKQMKAKWHMEPKDLDILNKKIKFANGTTIKWKVKPKPFKIIGRLLDKHRSGKEKRERAKKALAETKFDIRLNHDVSDDVEIMVRINGDFLSITSPESKHDLKMQFKATQRF